MKFYQIVLLLLPFSTFSQKKNCQVYLDSARYYKSINEDSAAIENAFRAHECDRENSEYMIQIGDLLLEHNHFDNAFTWYNVAFNDFNNLYGLIGIGEILKAKGFKDMAIQKFDQVIYLTKVDSIKIEMCILIADIYDDKREFKKGYEYTLMAYEIDQTNLDILNNMAVATEHVAAVPEDFQFYMRKGLAIDPENNLLTQNLGYLFMKSGNYDSALVYINKALTQDSESAYPINNRGYCYLMKGDLERAHADFKKSKELDPNNPYVYRNFAYYYIEKKQIGKACNNLKKAKDLNFSKKHGSEVDGLIRQYCE